jgi:ParB family chromosome partitioning protein
MKPCAERAFSIRSEHGCLSVEVAILQTAHSTNDTGKALHEAAGHYKVDVAAITANIKQKFAAKEKAKTAKWPCRNRQPRPSGRPLPPNR